MQVVTEPSDSTGPVFPRQSAAVRRTDVMLRATYPQLKTRIFEIAPFAYRIVFARSILNADQIRSEFDESIRPVTLQIELSNDTPSHFLAEIPPIGDHELARGLAGLPLTREDIRTILAGKFPQLPELLSIGSARPPAQTLTFERQLTAEEEATVLNFFDHYEPGWPVAFAAHDTPTEQSKHPFSVPGDMLQIRPARSRPKAPRFVQEDEAFWFDHVDAIFEGGMSPASILDHEIADMACYLDASPFPQIDLRQAILCYDTIFMSPPLSEPGVPSFWETQAVSRDGVLELIHAGRLKFCDSQKSEPILIFLRQPTTSIRPPSSAGEEQQRFLPPI